MDQSHLTQIQVGYNGEDHAQSLYPEEEEGAEKEAEEMEILEQIDEVSEKMIPDTESLPDVSISYVSHDIILRWL